MYLYQPDHRLPATEFLFDAKAVRTVLDTWLKDCQSDPVIGGIRYKPGTSCIVQFHTQTNKEQPAFHIKAFPKHNWQLRKRNLLRKCQGVRFNDEYCFALFRFPADSELSSIRRLVQNPQDFVTRVLYRDYHCEKLVNYELLAYKPNRRLTARLDFESGRKAVLKLHNASTFQNVLNGSRIWKKTNPLDIPKRVGRSNHARSLVCDWIHGDCFEVPDGTAGIDRELVEQIFELLDRLHAQVPRGSAGKPIPKHLQTVGIAEMASYLATIFPPARPILEKVAEHLLAHTPEKFESKLVHGDFHPKQIVRNGNSIRLVDFDNCCLGDQTFDIANFASHLDYEALIGTLHSNPTSYLDELAMEKHSANGNLHRRYQWNRATCLLRLASHPFRAGHQNCSANFEIARTTH